MYISPEYGVYMVEPISAYNVTRVENSDLTNKNYVKFQINLPEGGRLEELENYQVAHFRMLSDSNFIPYGKSIIEGGRTIDKKLISNKRVGNTFEIQSKNSEIGIYNASFNAVQKEHVLIFDNVTVFSDILLQLGTGFRQQRLKDNPSINLNIEDLNRYPGAKTNEFEYKSGPGFHFQGSDSDDKVESFKRKIVPTTLSKMKKWGYIDALNLMTTLKLDGEKGDIFGHLSNNFIQANKATIIKGIKDALGERFKNEKFNQWAISATQEIGGDPKLITQQSIWDGKFRYVQLKDVYTLKGPITLNEQVDGGNIKIHANPHKNLGEGAVLTTADNLTAREINFTSESLPQEIKDAYTKKYADITDIESKPLESKTPEPEALAYTLLKYRPKTAVNSPNTAYVNQTLFRSDVNLTRDKNTNMLSLGTYFYPNFYHTYEKNSDLSNSEAILDLSSSRRYIGEDNEWASFIGAPPKNGSGWANSIINTPLWTLNYPLYKNTWNYSFGGDKGYIGLDEVISTKDGKFVANGDNISKGYLNNIDSNTRRNWSTWWGLNQWGVDDASDYYLPLAYMAVMSFGFQHPKLEYMTGHFAPWDGNGDYDLSSFSNFTSTAIVANLPKSYVLLIGAILWRMKETNLLRWDKNENGEGILPKRNAINTDNKGWNWLNASFLGGSNNQPGIDDLNDPVWFFHTSTSKPKYVGGSVYAIPEGNPGFTIEANSSNHGSYERRWKGAYGGGESDRWTNGGGSIAQGFTLSNPVLIGKKQSLNTANINVTSHSDTEGWTKGQLSTLTVDSNKARGYYDMCRADQVPFLMNYCNDDFKRPRTLVITSLSKKEKKYDKDNKTPNLHESYYPVLKEECKELMFIPRALKIQFIDAFENWATGENSKWISTLDPLNWKDNGTLDNFFTITDKNVSDNYKRAGYRGFLTYNTYNANKFNTFIDNEASNLFAQRFSFVDSGTLGSNQVSLNNRGNSNTSNSTTINEYNYELQCFVSGTKIKLSNGKDINVEDLTKEHRLLTYNLANKIFEESTIGDIKIDYRENVLTYYFENGKKITCTDDHPIWVVNKEWSSYRQNNLDINGHNIKTKQIMIGDECLFYSDNNFVKSKLTKVIEKRKMVRVWHIINVTFNKNLIANNILVHNKPAYL